jgi:hypothetical protein
MLTSARLKKLARWCEKKAMHLGQLDILVEDAVLRRASKVNSAGVPAQIKFLVKKMGGADAFKTAVRKEKKSLQRSQMVRQSKTDPEQNISYQQVRRLKKKSKRRMG